MGADAFVYYEGHLASYPHVMVGKLLLNPRYLIFHVYEPGYGGLLEAPRLNSTGRVLSIPLDKLMDVTIDSGVRSRKSRPNWKNKDDFQRKSTGERGLNSHPGLLDNTESFRTLMLTIETDGGVEIARFEVQNPHEWFQSLKKRIPKGSA